MAPLILASEARLSSTRFRKKWAMLKRIKIARPAFAKQLVRYFVTRGFSQPILKQFRLRKFIAILMLAMIGGFYAAPLLQAASSDPDAGLPACCRRHGKHHCAMMDRYLKSIDSGTPQIRTTPQHCPFYPHSSSAPVLRYHAGLAPSAAIFAQVVSHPAIHPQTHAVYRLSLDRSRQKRGPPSLPLCS